MKKNRTLGLSHHCNWCSSLVHQIIQADALAAGSLRGPPLVILGWLSCHGREHSQTIFTIEILNEILDTSSCIIDFFCKSMTASNLCDDKRSVLRGSLTGLHSHLVNLLTRLVSGAMEIYSEREEEGRCT